MSIVSEESIARHLNEMNKAQASLEAGGFEKLSVRREGFLCISKFINGPAVVTFLFGPPEWHVEIKVETPDRNLSAKDLIVHPEIKTWIDGPGNQKESADKSEELWWAELISAALPLIE